MKKIIFVFAMFCAMSFAACGNKTADAETVDSTAVDSIEVVDSIESVDSVAADSVEIG
jgi:hypothetical protein